MFKARHESACYLLLQICIVEVPHPFKRSLGLHHPRYALGIQDTLYFDDFPKKPSIKRIALY